jgi:hypothetical protein
MKLLEGNLLFTIEANKKSKNKGKSNLFCLAQVRAAPNSQIFQKRTISAIDQKRFASNVQGSNQ